MQCPCGGTTKWLVAKGESYQCCQSCGRADPPKCLHGARMLAVAMRQGVPYKADEETTADAIALLHHQTAPSQSVA